MEEPRRDTGTVSADQAQMHKQRWTTPGWLTLSLTGTGLALALVGQCGNHPYLKSTVTVTSGEALTNTGG
jgi:hypothetical protein